MSDTWIETNGLCRYYRRGEDEVRAVDRVDLRVERGEFVALVGASGSGKSTLLNLMAGLDTPTAGDVTMAGEKLGTLARRELARFRANRIGIVFQSFHLIPHLTAVENVELALCFASVNRADRRPRALAVLDELGLSDRVGHKPGDLSGGEQQRTALARAIASDPDILLADEPTGNLDRENTDNIAGLLRELNGRGRTIIMSTHDHDLARSTASRIIRIAYGRTEPEGSVTGGEGP